MTSMQHGGNIYTERTNAPDLLDFSANINPFGVPSRRLQVIMHFSPNSAQTESVAAGAMGIQLGGTHVYFGKVVEKPTIGDVTRHAQPTDILTANRLLFGSSLLFAGLVGGLLLWLSL